LAQGVFSFLSDSYGHSHRPRLAAMEEIEPMGDFVHIAEDEPRVVALRGRAANDALRLRWRHWWRHWLWRLRRRSGADVLARAAAACHPAVATLLVALATMLAALIGLWGWIWMMALKATVLRMSRGWTKLPCEEPLLNYYMLVDLCFNLLPMALVCVPEVYQRWGLFLSLPLPLVWTVVGVVVIWEGPPCGGKRDVDLFGSVRLYVYLAALGYLLAALGAALVLLDEVAGYNLLGRLYWSIALEPETPAPPLLSPEEAMHGLPRLPPVSPELNDKDCLICFGNFASGGEFAVRTLCGHHWHEQCLANWCRSRLSCPLCRAPIGDILAVT